MKPDKALNLMRNLNLSTPVLPFGDASNFVISPDGSEILFASMNDFNQAKQAWSTNVNIYSLRIDDDLNTKPVCLTGYNPGVNNAPTFSPNGQKIAYLEMRVFI